ncbi:MAG: signal peptide peptidase SppA [Bacteroidaceae bacterium]|nr:signal peptide peptidase SppA [Bacteroidaceae bacterium]
MKNFLKYTLATMVGIVLTGTLFSILALVSLIGIIAIDSTEKPIQENSILRLNLTGEMQERSDNNPFAKLMGEESNAVSLEQAVTALKKAAVNDNIKGVYLEAGTLSAQPATVQELRQALVDFKKSGKWIVSYADSYGKMGYYLSSVADTLLLNPEGSVDFSGLESQPMFFKEVLDKLGIEMQVFKVGTYKSAVEPFICTEMSDANREQITSYLTSVWNNVLSDVAASRNIDVDKLNKLADTQTMFARAQSSVDNGLIDALCYIDQVKDILRSNCNLVNKDDKLSFASISDVANSAKSEEGKGEQIAVYYACGDIVQSASTGLNQEVQIVGEKVVKDLQALRTDPKVKAVVIRVNSPGGSAYASEQIWREVTLLKKEKPVIISMGDVAASGGYYISCASDRIFADPTTITGSIGIFGMVPNVSNLLTKKIGLKFDIVKTNEMADMGTMSRPFNAAERAQLQKMIEQGYDTFTKRVADGRGMSQDSVKLIAEGRVWTGEQGLKIGLVDELGNLDDAIAYAAKMIESKEYHTVSYPAEEDPFAMILNETKSDYMNNEIKELLGEWYSVYSFIRNINNADRIQARLPFEPNIH